MAKQSWKNLSPRTRKLAVAAGAVQTALLTAAQADLARRPAKDVNGSKAKWRLIILINFVGPIAYFWKGRRRRG